MVWKCGLCLLVLTITLRELIHHIALHHSTEENFNVFCGIDGCGRNYRKFNSFYKHVRREHEGQYGMNPKPNATPEAMKGTESTIPGVTPRTIAFRNTTVQDVPDGSGASTSMAMGSEVNGSLMGNAAEEAQCTLPSQDMDDNSDLDMEDFEDEDVQPEVLPNYTPMTIAAAKFLVGIKEKNDITQVAVDNIKDSCEGFIRLLMNQLEDRLMDGIADLNLENENDIQDCVIAELNQMINPFDSVGTAYKQSKIVSEVCKAIVPQKIILGRRLRQQYVQDIARLQFKPDFFYYISIKDSVKQMLSNTKWRSLILSPITYAPDGYLIDFVDGSAFKSNELFVKHSKKNNCLFIQLYYDDVEICNPLGSASRKLALFYFRLLNLPKIYRSKISGIRLLGVCENSLLKKYGVDAMLKPMVEELQYLGVHGWNFIFPDGRVDVTGGLHSVVGDTIASNAVGGFKESPGGSFDKCRICQCTQDMLQNLFKETDFTMLNLVDYLHHCNIIENEQDDYMRNWYQTTFGLNRKTVLCNVPYFDLTTGMPYDTMHVLYEGVVQYEIKEILRKLIVIDKIFKLDEYNEQLKVYFRKSKLETINKPNELTTAVLFSTEGKKNIKLSAEKAKQLLRALPFILIGLILIDNECFKLISQLSEICNIILAPVISLETLDHLSHLISLHLSKFKNLCEANLIPKHHFLIHFPTMIKTHGPLNSVNTDRYESNHRKTKRKLLNRLNYKNVSLSTVNSNCLEEAINFDCVNDGDQILFKDDFVTGYNANCDVNTILYVKDKLKSFCNVTDGTLIENVNSTKYITVGGTKYISNHHFLAYNVNEIRVEFGKIHKIYLINNFHVFFELIPYETIYFNEDFQSFSVKERDMAGGNEFCSTDTLVDYNAYTITNVDGEFFIPVHFDIQDLTELCIKHGNKIHNQFGKLIHRN